MVFGPFHTTPTAAILPGLAGDSAKPAAEFGSQHQWPSTILTGYRSFSDHPCLHKKTPPSSSIATFSFSEPHPAIKSIGSKLAIKRLNLLGFTNIPTGNACCWDKSCQGPIQPERRIGCDLEGRPRSGLATKIAEGRTISETIVPADGIVIIAKSIK